MNIFLNSLASESEVAHQVDRAFWILIGISAVLLLGITLAMIYFTIHYRRKQRKTTKQIKGNFFLEATWITIPTIIVVYMFFVGYKGFKMMRNVPPDARIVQVTGQQWFWTFTYPEEGISSDRLVLPVNEPVRFELSAPIGDVIHSFYIPAYRIKEDVLPGGNTYSWILPERTGTHHIFCAEFCGKNHAQMYTTLDVVTKAEYEAWINDRLADKYKPVDMTVAMNPNSDEIQKRDAPKLFRTYCASCHGVNGRGGLVEGARNFTSLAGWKQGTRITDIFRTLAEGIPGTRMRSFRHLPAWDRFALAHYVAAFYTGNDRPKDSQASMDKLLADYKLDKPWKPRKKVTLQEAMQTLIEESSPPPAP